MRTQRDRTQEHRSWIWWYRITTIYVTVMITLAVLLLLKGAQ